MIPNASPFAPGDKVVGYCRYSEGVEQGQKDTSTEEQAAAIRAFCEAHELQLVRIYADPYASGRSTKGRDHYLEMLSDLLKKHKPDIQGLILWDWERYGRNYNQAQLDAARLRMAGYKLFSMQQPILDDGPFAHVLEAMYFASAQNQSDMISADVTRALQHNFKTYKVIPRSSIGWGFVPVPVPMGTFRDGSARVGYKAEPDPEKIGRIRAAVKLRLAGGSIDECRNVLGLRTDAQVRRLFANPLLFGRMIYGETVTDDYCEPIISEKTWSELQAYDARRHMKIRGRQGGWSADRPLLSGLLHCAVCGGPMYLYRRTSKGHTYESYYCERSCFRGVKADELERLIIATVAAALTPDSLAVYRDQFIAFMESAPEAKGEREDSIQKQIADLEMQIDNMTAAIARGVLSDALVMRLKAAEDEKAMLVGELSACTDIDADKMFDEIVKVSASVRMILLDPECDKATKKTALDTCVRSILVSDDGHVLINTTLPGLLNRHGSKVVGNYGDKDQAPPEERRFILQLRTRLASFIPGSR